MSECLSVLGGGGGGGGGKWLHTQEVWSVLSPSVLSLQLSPSLLPNIRHVQYIHTSQNIWLLGTCIHKHGCTFRNWVGFLVLGSSRSFPLLIAGAVESNTLPLAADNSYTIYNSSNICSIYILYNGDQSVSGYWG